VILVDSHVHFDDFRQTGDLDDVVTRAVEAGVENLLAVGGGPAENDLAVELAHAYPGIIRAVVAYDRDNAGREVDMGALRALLQEEGVAGIGEIGLDYYYGAERAIEQRRLFGRMLETAAAHDLPVVVHSREAQADTLAMLADYAAARPAAGSRLGVLHCFTGGIEFAERLLEIGFMISLSGVVSFRNAGELRRVAAILPAERLLLETDSPFLTPEPLRGRRNEPANVIHVARAVAAARGTSVEALAAVTACNAARLFGFPERLCAEAGSQTGSG